jgi:hypothetical protein
MSTPRSDQSVREKDKPPVPAVQARPPHAPDVAPEPPHSGQVDGQSMEEPGYGHGV